MLEVGLQSEAAEQFLSAAWTTGVDVSTCRRILGVLVERRAPKGAILLEQGLANDHLSFLIAGSASIERTRAGGRVETLAALASPSIFGTTSFFTPEAPTFSVRAASDVWLLTLGHRTHDRLRREDPVAAEGLALIVLRVLSVRFSQLDTLFSDYMAGHPDDPVKVTEWARFRARLFEEPAD
jgi:CRP/FNR family transcriptional regulator, cyclic AMP receptor protein